MENFENKLRNLLFDVREYGIVETIIQYQNNSLILEDFNQRLITNCHLGFRKAQNCIIEEIINNQNDINQLEESLKSHRINRNKIIANELQNEIKIKKNQNKVYIKIADTIAWQLFYAQSYVIRRLYTGRTDEVNLSESNIQYAQEAINNLHTKYPESIALISDITSCISIGDILFKNFEKISVIELKQGKTNEVIQNIILEAQLLGTPKETFINKIKENYNQKFVKQTQRMLNQSIRMKRLSDIINNSYGIDNLLELPIVISETKVKINSYTYLLQEMINKLWLDNKNWMYEVVENCIHIGVYHHSFAEAGINLISKIIASKTHKDFPIFNYISLCLNEPLAEPFFLKPFTKDQLVAMIFKKIEIYIIIDFDELINIFHKNGLKSDWMSRKETENVKLNTKNQIFTFENQGIECRLNDAIFYLGKGWVSKMIFNNILPSSIAESLIRQQAEIIEKIKFASKADYNLPILVQSIGLNVEPYL